MTSELIDRAVPENSPLIRAGLGQMMAGNTQHPAQLPASEATKWISRIKAGLPLVP